MPLEVSREEQHQIFTILERVLFLREVEIFKNVDTERLAVIAEIAKEIEVVSSETVAREGEIGESLYIIKKGSLRIVKEKDGKQYTLKKILPGECFGVFGILGERRRSTGAVATEDTTLLEIKKNEFKKVLLSNPEIAYNILEILSLQINELDNEIVLLNKTLNATLAGRPEKS